MGARYKDLRKERDDAVKAMEGFVVRLSLKPGDMVVFKVDPKSIGTAFGVGWGAMDNISKMMSQMAGGPVRCIATTDRNPFDVTNLDRFGRSKLRALLNQLDAAAPMDEKESKLPFPAVATPR